ncbi:MAG: substrate-binding domain-containing protein, partial [Spirochaetaceae bacterium]|nr:substrate-binding domain-containing protein [Spirochaetaceae bacterium]
VGYDDIDLGSYARPALTTVHQPLGEIAALACERLIELLSGRGPSRPRHRLVSPSLVIRET